MKAIPLFCVKLLCFLVCISCDNDANTPPTESNSAFDTSVIYEALDVPYGNAERQKLDVFLPANRTRATKTLLLVHGGSWVSGKKEDMNIIKQLILQEFDDVAVVNMNYRLANATTKVFPTQIDDITNVVNFLKSNAERYNISETIGFVGVSAGAHLAMLWSYGFDTSNSVSMVSSIVGPTNFTDPNYQNTENPELLGLLEVLGNDTSTAFLEQVSPFHQLTAKAPATILFYGGQDPLVPTTQGTALRDKLEALNVTNQFTLYENAGHGWLGPELIDTWSKLKLFIENNL